MEAKTQSKHTPGPWKVSKESKGTFVRAYHGGMVASMESGYQLMRDEDVKLIAAAPELLEACKKALYLIRETWIEEHGNELVGETWGAIETAIEKAEGGKQHGN